MDEFKFSCPVCLLHIQVNGDFQNRRIECPGCKTTLLVPAPSVDGATVPLATQVQPPAKPLPVSTEASKTANAPLMPPTPSFPHPPVAPAPVPDAEIEPLAPLPPSDPETDAIFKSLAPGPSGTVTPINDIRVNILTPELKLAIVHDIRPRLADKSRWLPGKKDAGHYIYAARNDGDKLVPVPPIDVSATHFSLVGAVQLEFHRHNVMQSALGRKKFLDEELTAAIHEALGHPAGTSPISDAEWETFTHEQCLAALDILERNLQKPEEPARLDAGRKPDQSSDADASKKPSAPADGTIIDLKHELEEIKQRLEKLERNARGNK